MPPAILLALSGSEDAEAVTHRRQCLKVIRKGANEDGGWGPYVVAASEPFDTAVVMSRLAAHPERTRDQRDAETRPELFGGAAERRRQLAETTRPARAESYRPTAFDRRLGHPRAAGDRGKVVVIVYGIVPFDKRIDGS